MAQDPWQLNDETEWQTLGAFTLPSEPGNERQAVQHVVEIVHDLALPSERLERLKTAVSEATMNAMEHGNRFQPDQQVAVRVLVSRRALAVQVTDEGTSGVIRPPETPDLEAKLAGKQSPRGWGFFLIEKMVDELRVTANDAHHRIELFLYLEGDTRGREESS